VRLELPLRAPFELGHGFQRHGFVFEPRIVYETGSDGGIWQAAASAGAVVGNAGLHAYFYDVAPQYATPWRPAYQAHGGLMATRVGLNLSRRLGPDWRVFGLMRYDHLGQAANRDSPLLRRDGGWSAGMGVTWTLYRSAARAWD
jgi:outer membrane scaffolding protein for murein synthesis (MipA/OmpV family)